VAMEGMGSGNDDTKDNAGSVKVAGMENVVNWGTDHVKAGDVIGVCGYSHTILTSNGQEIPSIVLGADKDGMEPANVYKPRVYVMHSSNVTSALLNAQLAIDNGLATISPDSGKDTVIRIVSNYNQSRGYHSSFPINAHLYMILAERLLTMHDSGLLAERMTLDECRQVLDHCFKTYFEWKKRP